MTRTCIILDLSTKKKKPRRLININSRLTARVCVCVSLEYEGHHVSPVNPGLCCWLTSGLCGTEAGPRTRLSLRCLLLTAYNTGLNASTGFREPCFELRLHIWHFIQHKIKQSEKGGKKKTDRQTNAVHLQRHAWTSKCLHLKKIYIHFQCVCANTWKKISRGNFQPKDKTLSSNS